MSTPDADPELAVARRFLAAMGWTAALDGGDFFPHVRQAAREATWPLVERMASEAWYLRRRVAQLEDRVAQLAHANEQLQDGMRLLLDQLGYPPQAADATGEG